MDTKAMDFGALYFSIPYVFNFNVYVFYILVSLVSVLLRPTTSLPLGSFNLYQSMYIDVTMCMLMLLFYDSCAMLAVYVSIKFLHTYKPKPMEHVEIITSQSVVVIIYIDVFQ